MNNSKLLYPLLYIGIGIALTLLFIQGCQKRVLEYWEVEDFKTDTVIVEKPITIKEILVDTFKITIPPKIITQYKLAPTEYVEIECDNDSLITLLDSLGDELTEISKAFVLNAPTSSKIISGLFTKGDLELTLLNTQGELYNLGYKVNYDEFKYQYIDNQIKVEALEKGVLNKDGLSKSAPFEHGLYISPGYSILDKKLTGSLDYLITYGKLQGGLEGMVTLEKSPQLMLHAKVGLKVK